MSRVKAKHLTFIVYRKYALSSVGIDIPFGCRYNLFVILCLFFSYGGILCL